MLTPEVWALVTFWADWKTLGVLPFGGRSAADEPAHVGEVLRICERTLREVQHEAQEEQRRAHDDALVQLGKGKR